MREQKREMPKRVQWEAHIQEKVATIDENESRHRFGLAQAQQDAFDKMAGTQKTIADNAFHAWLRVLRWKSNNGYIGRPVMVGPESGWGTYLIEENTGHRFWAATRVLSLPPGQAVTLAEWNDAAQALRSGVFSPVYYDLMFDAIEHFHLENFQRSIVDSAVACESYMRAKVMTTVPLSRSDSIRRYIDEANIRQVLNHFFPEILTEEKRVKRKGINSILQQLFNARNTILHSGHKADLTLSDCQKYLEATQKLIALG